MEFRSAQDLVKQLESKFNNCLIEQKNYCNVVISLNSEFNQEELLIEDLKQFKEVKISGRKFKTYEIVCQEFLKSGLRILNVKY